MKSKTDKLAYVNPISREMRFFMTCAEEGSILQASERLSVQQAGLSKIIQKLEREIGKDLFFREPRGIKLTEYGKTLYESLQKTNQFWNQSYFNRISTTFGLSGSFKIGCHASVAANIFPLFLQKVTESFPNLKVDVEFMRSSEATRSVSQNHLDMGIVINPVKNSELSVIKIRKEYVGLWKSRGDNQNTLVINPDIFKYPLLINKFKSRKPLEIADYETIANLVRNSDLQGILPNAVAERHGLEMVGTPLFHVDMAVVINRKHMLNDEKMQVVELIVQTVRTELFNLE